LVVYNIIVKLQRDSVTGPLFPGRIFLIPQRIADAEAERKLERLGDGYPRVISTRKCGRRLPKIVRPTWRGH